MLYLLNNILLISKLEMINMFTDETKLQTVGTREDRGKAIAEKQG